MAHSQYAKRYPLGKSIRDHARNRTHPNVDNEAISQQLEELVKPCVYNQLAYYRSLEMRERIYCFASSKVLKVPTWVN